MVFDCFGSSRLIGIAQLPFAITHDQQALDAQVIAAVLEFLQVRLVFSFVLEELVDVLHASMPNSWCTRGTHVVELAAINRAVQ